MILVKATTKKGQQLIEKASAYEGYYLSDVYGSWSQAKQDGWNYCWEKFQATKDSENFAICSHNQRRFSCSWEGIYIDQDGEHEAVFLETAAHSYIIF